MHAKTRKTPTTLAVRLQRINQTTLAVAVTIIKNFILNKTT